MNNLENLVNFNSVVGRQSRSVLFDANEIAALRKERILVTGAGGSIGSQIVKFISQIEGLNYLATDRDESSLHTLSLELDARALFESPSIALLDIRDQRSIDNVLEIFKPTLIIHAAALKHLNALQKQPREALLSNVFGTANLVDSASRYKIKKFVNISTDKAAEPKNVLGFSKMLAEIYIAHARSVYSANFTSCRFGNVFNSRGSVIETFIHQILQQKPITLTHREIKRFFMSIEEAAHLTLKSFLINSGDVHIFDMGEPIPLTLIIENLQSVLGMKSSVIVTGLRDGEKMSEDLFGDNEESFDTSEPRITCANLNLGTEESRTLIDLIKSRNETLLLEKLSSKTKVRIV